MKWSGPNILKLRRKGRRRKPQSSAEPLHARAGKDGRPFVACSAWLGRADEVPDAFSVGCVLRLSELTSPIAQIEAPTESANNVAEYSRGHLSKELLDRPERRRALERQRAARRTRTDQTPVPTPHAEAVQPIADQPEIDADDDARESCTSEDWQDRLGPWTGFKQHSNPAAKSDDPSKSGSCPKTRMSAPSKLSGGEITARPDEVKNCAHALLRMCVPARFATGVGARPNEPKLRRGWPRPKLTRRAVRRQSRRAGRKYARPTVACSALLGQQKPGCARTGHRRNAAMGGPPGATRPSPRAAPRHAGTPRARARQRRPTRAEICGSRIPYVTWRA